VLQMVTLTGLAHGIHFGLNLNRKMATSLVAFLPMCQLDPKFATTPDQFLIDNVAVVVEEKELDDKRANMDVLFAKEDAQIALLEFMLSKMKSDDQEIKAFIGRLIALCGVTAVITEVVLVYNDRVTKEREAAEEEAKKKKKWKWKWKNRFW